MIVTISHHETVHLINFLWSFLFYTVGFTHFIYEPFLKTSAYFKLVYNWQYKTLYFPPGIITCYSFYHPDLFARPF